LWVGREAPAFHNAFIVFIVFMGYLSFAALRAGEKTAPAKGSPPGCSSILFMAVVLKQGAKKPRLADAEKLRCGWA
jgi:hypothetical protein